MVRPKKVLTAVRGREEEPADGSLMVQSRSRRTIKPNPKYNSQETLRFDVENDTSRNTEDDEDFRDDGAKDSDLEDTPPAKKRGRPRAAEAPRSEPQPQRRLQQIRQDFRDTARSTSKVLQQSAMASAAGLLEKKRKLDYDADEGESDEPNAKRRSGPTTPAAAVRPGLSIRPVASATPTSGKENASSLLKKDVKLVNIEQILNKGTATAKTNPVATTPGSGTRRQLGTASSPVSTGIVRSAITITSTSVKDPTGRLPVQVRRPAQVVTTPAPAKVLSPAAAPAAAAVAQKSPAPEKQQVILNRTPVVKPKPATPSNRLVALKGSPSPVGSNRLLNRGSSSPLVKPYLVPAGAHLESMPDGKTRVTTFEKRFVVRVPGEECAAAEEEQEERAAKESISLIKLRREIKSLKMPTTLWSYQMKLHARRGAPDPLTDVPDKPGYMVHSILLNRLVVQTSPKLLNGQTVDTRQYDRTVELLKSDYKVTIDGRPVTLMGAPKTVTDKVEVETLLQIVNHVSIDSLVVKADGA